MKTEIHRAWEQVVIPDWDNMVKKTETRELWWRGVAPSFRSTVWSRALGNQLTVTEETFRLALERARELEKGMGSIQTTKEQEMFAAIRRDVNETFPDLKIFQVRLGAPWQSWQSWQVAPLIKGIVSNMWVVIGAWTFARKSH